MSAPKTPRKWERVLTALLAGRTLNRFEAERPVHEGGLSDHCLPSTISDIQRKGVRVERKHESVPSYLGIPTECARYWVDLNDAANVAKGRALLGPSPTVPAAQRISSERWDRAVRAAEQEHRDRAARAIA